MMFNFSSLTALAEVFQTEYLLASAVIAIMNLILILPVTRKFMQIVQQSGYVCKEYFRWLYRRENIYFTRLVMIVMLSVLAYFIVSISLSFIWPQLIVWIAFLLYALFIYLYVKGDFKRKEKSPLVFTARIIRQYLTFALLFFAITFTLVLLSNVFAFFVKDKELLIILRLIIVCVTPLLVPVLVPLATLINKPMENANNQKYVKKCKQKLAENKNLIKIGITGSYGKTSVKEILKVMLCEKYSVLSTPASYNTPMGICKTVKHLNDSYDIFIAEMGARHEGDIKELCDIVPLDYGIISGIVEHHMETFLSLNQIKKTKFELVGGIKKAGAVIITSDNENTLSMKGSCGDVEVVTAGIDLTKNPDVYATDISVSPSGTSFNLCINGEVVPVHTVLLGSHSVSNVCLAAALCLKLGLTVEEICAGISRIRPVKHRLETFVNDRGITIIDDSYNSNVYGTKSALEVFQVFSGRKIILTPGMVELGRIEDFENTELGKRLAKVVDYAILIGSFGAYKIRDGMLSCGFELDNIFMAKDLDEASAHLAKISKPGDVVLFENDLPDKFS